MKCLNPLRVRKIQCISGLSTSHSKWIIEKIWNCFQSFPDSSNLSDIPSKQGDQSTRPLLRLISWDKVHEHTEKVFMNVMTKGWWMYWQKVDECTDKRLMNVLTKTSWMYWQKLQANIVKKSMNKLRKGQWKCGIDTVTAQLRKVTALMQWVIFLMLLLGISIKLLHKTGVWIFNIETEIMWKLLFICYNVFLDSMKHQTCETYNWVWWARWSGCWRKIMGIFLLKTNQRHLPCSSWLQWENFHSFTMMCFNSNKHQKFTIGCGEKDELGVEQR